jgi:opacity protein-like surface antigen
MILARTPFVASAAALRRAALSLALAAPLALPLSARADAAPAEPVTPAVKIIVGALLTGTVTSDNASTVTNPDGSTASGNLAGRYELLAGAEFPLDPNGLAVRLTAGVHIGEMSASTGAGERFVRFPLEATLWYPLNPRLHVGAGVRYAMRMRFTGPGRNTSDQLNATPSLLAGFEYQLLPNVALQARYVYERYEQASGVDLEGSHFGVGVTASY